MSYKDEQRTRCIGFQLERSLDFENDLYVRNYRCTVILAVTNCKIPLLRRFFSVFLTRTDEYVVSCSLIRV